MNDQKKIMNIFAQAYQLIAKASKQQPSQEGFQQVLEMLGEDGIKQCAEVVDQGPEAVAQAMVQILQQKSTQKAANGAKLRYLMQLKGKCEPGYLKKGGRCKPCEKSKGVFQNKADLMQNGGNVDQNKEAKRLTTKKYGEEDTISYNVPGISPAISGYGQVKAIKYPWYKKLNTYHNPTDSPRKLLNVFQEEQVEDKRPIPHLHVNYGRPKFTPVYDKNGEINLTESQRKYYESGIWKSDFDANKRTQIEDYSKKWLDNYYKNNPNSKPFNYRFGGNLVR